MCLSSSTWTDCTGFQTNPSNTRITLVSNNRLRDNRWLARPQSNRNQGLVCADKACTQAKKTYCVKMYLIEGSLVAKLPTMWIHGKAKVGRFREEKGIRKNIREETEVRRKKMQVHEKVKSRDTVFFPCFVDQEGRKVGLLKRRVRSHWVRSEIENCIIILPSMAPLHDFRRSDVGQMAHGQKEETQICICRLGTLLIVIMLISIANGSGSNFCHPSNNSVVMGMADTRPSKSSEHAIHWSLKWCWVSTFFCKRNNF